MYGGPPPDSQTHSGYCRLELIFFMSKAKKRICRHWAALLLAVVLSLALAPAALADTGSNTPKITQQPDQLILQLGTRWAGVEFELRTDAGVFPAPVVVDEGGVLRMDLGGSTTYTLSCIESSVPIPGPTEGVTPGNEAIPPADNIPEQVPPQTPEPEPAPVPGQQNIPLAPLMVFLVGLAAVGGGMIVYWVMKRRQQDSYDEWDDDEAE